MPHSHARPDGKWGFRFSPSSWNSPSGSRDSPVGSSGGVRVGIFFSETWPRQRWKQNPRVREDRGSRGQLLHAWSGSQTLLKPLHSTYGGPGLSNKVGWCKDLESESLHALLGSATVCVVLGAHLPKPQFL